MGGVKSLKEIKRGTRDIREGIKEISRGSKMGAPSLSAEVPRDSCQDPLCTKSHATTMFFYFILVSFLFIYYFEKVLLVLGLFFS